MNDPRLFHLVDCDAWRSHRSRGSELWEPASLEREGFVHLSFAAQVAGTLAAHFTSPEALFLLEVDGRALDAELVLEPSRGGALFPHLYRGLRHAELLRSWRLEREAGAWRPPILGASAGEDDPHGGPLP